MPASAENPASGFIKTEGTKIELNKLEMQSVLDTEGRQYWTKEEIDQLGEAVESLDAAIQSELLKSVALKKATGSGLTERITRKIFNIKTPEENAADALAKIDSALEEAIDGAKNSTSTVTAQINNFIDVLEAPDSAITDNQVFKNQDNTKSFLTSIGLISSDAG